MNKFKEYLEAVSNKKLGLTDKIKKDILKDYKTWSSGFSPDEMEEKDHKKYVKFALNTNYKNLDKEILEWLKNYEVLSSTKETTKSINDQVEELMNYLSENNELNTFVTRMDNYFAKWSDSKDSDLEKLYDKKYEELEKLAIKKANFFITRNKLNLKPFTSIEQFQDFRGNLWGDYKISTDINEPTPYDSIGEI